MDYKELIAEIRESNVDNVPMIEAWATAIETLLAERDALYKLVEKRFWLNPEECSHYENCYKKAHDDMRMLHCPSCKRWQWRGITKGE